jgi:hypothetical protein
MAKKAKKTYATQGGAKKNVAKKARAGGSNVSFGLHGMREILERIKRAGLEEALNEHMDSNDLFAKVQQSCLYKLKTFIDSNKALATLSNDTSTCNCPPNDPYCIYLG